MTDQNIKWKLLGNFNPKGRLSVAAAAIAVIFASETFITPAGHYSAYMSAIALIAGGYAAFRAFKTKSIVGLVIAPVALLWLEPLFGGTWFDAMGVTFFISHAVFAMLYAIAAYTFMRGLNNGK